jgi:hypothetical protein
LFEGFRRCFCFAVHKIPNLGTGNGRRHFQVRLAELLYCWAG